MRKAKFLGNGARKRRPDGTLTGCGTSSARTA